MEKPRYFDVHSHINDAQFDDDREVLIDDMARQGVWTITVGTDKSTSRHVAELTTHENVFASVGVHPVDDPTEVFDESFFDDLIGKFPKIVAIGECGLDYYRLEGSAEQEKKRQKVLFEQQVECAVRHDLPLMIHTRDARGSNYQTHRDLIDILGSKKKEYGDALRGNIHFFSGDTDIARSYFDMNFSISLGGVITFTDEYDDAVRYAPKELLLTETDAPYVAPVPYRGKRNSPLYVGEVAKRMAGLRGEKEEEFSARVVENAYRVFQIQERMAQ